MSRFEGGLTQSADAPLSVADLVAILSGQIAASDHERQRAIACFLSARDGWEEAAKTLGGAFASDAAETRLKDGKAE